MSPEIVVPPSPEVAEATESLDEAAITLDAVGEAIEAGNIANHEALAEVLKEVRECRIKVEALLTSTGAESPAIQQLLIQTGELQSKMDRLQAEVQAILNESEAEPADVEESSPQNISESLKREENDTKKSGEPKPQNPPQESNLSPIPEPKKRKYIKI